MIIGDKVIQHYQFNTNFFSNRNFKLSLSDDYSGPPVSAHHAGHQHGDMRPRYHSVSN